MTSQKICVKCKIKNCIFPLCNEIKKGHPPTMQVYEQLKNLLVLLFHNCIEMALLLVILLDNFYRKHKDSTANILTRQDRSKLFIFKCL